MSDNPAEAMRARLRADIKAAMQARQSDEVRVLRSMLGAVDNAQAVPTSKARQPYVERAFGDASVEVPRVHLTDEMLAAVLREEIDSRLAAAADLAKFGQTERATLLREEAGIVRRYLGE